MRTGWLPALFVVVASSAASAQPRVVPSCDRACLEGYVDRYLDAMLANEVTPKLFARDVKFTENGVRLPLGNEGLWFGMSGRGKYKFYVPDIETQQVAFIGTVIENTAARANTGQGNLVAIALRLKVVGGLITEVEQLAIRPDTGLGGARGGGRGAAAGGAAGAGARGAGGDAAAAGGTARGAGTAAPAAGAARGAGAAAPAGAGAPGTGDRVEAMGAPHAIFAEVVPE